MSNEVDMVAEIRQTYAGRALNVGDRFKATSVDADDLVAIKFAKRVKPVAPPQAKVHTTAVEADSEANAEVKQEEPQKNYPSNTQPRYPHRAMNSRR